jgi:UDP-N-acetyl-D-galactosamine dehydrogenase
MDEVRIGVIGLGYVGLPLAVAFSAHLPVTGFDIDPDRITALKSGQDTTLETSSQELTNARHLHLTSDPADLAGCNTYIVTVPTPIDTMKRPDLGPLRAASQTVGRVMAPGDVVIFESTVYPGATEEDCIPVIEAVSGLRFNVDFFAGYSPERINPGDRTHRLADIVKVTSGSTPEAAVFVDALYRRVVTAGTHLAPSIRVAEAAKVIENTQRDVNIALINELAMIFARMGLDTHEVLDAAGTKWNFLPFRPGLVGGHCIGVDPYYLTHKAQALGFDPQMVLAGRRINDGMGAWIVDLLLRRLIALDVHIKGARVLVLGISFKEDVPDLRNSRVIDIIRGLEGYGMIVDVHDPLVSAKDLEETFGLETVSPRTNTYDAVVLAVPHASFRAAGSAMIRSFLRDTGTIVDVKGILDRAPDILRI